MSVSTSSCPECAVAADKPTSPVYRLGCTECQCRQLAHGIEFAKSQAGAKMTQGYLAALAAIGGDRDATHMRVKRWAGRITAARMAA